MIMNDEISEPSSPETPFDESDLMAGMTDEVTSQLAHAGPIGVAAAAAIATGKKRKRPHSFETNPSIRRRQQTRLMRKLRATIDEYATRVGQQAVVICCIPGKGEKTFKVSGSCPLEGVMRNCRTVIMQDLEAALAQQAPAPPPENTNLHELPPLVIDGIPTPVDKMTQAQLRGFIPLMLKYSTGRGKPGWGKETCRPVWWPSDLPWANVRSDVRSDEDKRKVSWTHALRTIVKNCYKHHGREDLLPDFQETETHHHQTTHQLIPSHTVVQTINNADGTLSLIQVDTGNTVATLTDVSQVQQIQHVQQLGQVQHLNHIPHLQQVLIQQSQLQHAQLGVSQQAEATQAVQTLAEVAAATQNGTPVSVTMNGDGGHTVATLTEATLADGQIMLSTDANQSIVIPASIYPVSSISSDQMQVQHAQTIQTIATTDSNSVTVQAEAVQQTQNHANVPVASQAVEVVTLQEASIEQQ
ncbi:DNA-binding protein P3A2-like [Anneissia japonica]|uniref:DNA-binding protein P3A2-like n=1 Tax=Anneissia japonica TaxID=1529436 RepID=UPI0014255355|nr:DNA-binding protein P3A2-like [Anneissia japonica]XP_033122257.1 DNA-binding protein P3A2-like [Anneissia japonica]XP_033122259.1 DNA-binding protein P3A2-like [Anneissia japonica]XP_033122260.1 DNA-binding protein P3A2-like [Anneissia japonica]